MGRNYFELRVVTNLDLGRDEFVRALLDDWFRLPEELHPERFAFGEPIRRSIAQEGVDAVVAAWMSGGLVPCFKRVSRHKLELWPQWRWRRGKDTREFPWGCFGSLDRKAPDAIAFAFFDFLISQFRPAFSFLTDTIDQDEKHFITFQDLIGRTEMLRGFDVTDVVPGIYWRTFIGPGSFRIIDETRLRALPADVCRPLYDGYLISPYESSKLIATPEGKAREQAIMDELGREHFFDKTKFDIEPHKTRPEDVPEIEAAIERKKAETAARMSRKSAK